MATVTRLRVYNFRSIAEEIDVHFTRGMPVVLVGENNCGKSNVVRALDLVLGQTWPGSHEPDDNEFHLRDRSRPMWIAVDFEGTDRFGRGYDRVLWRYDSTDSEPIFFRGAPGLGTKEFGFISNDDRTSCSCITIEAERNLQYQLSYASKYTLLSRLMHRFHKAMLEDDTTKAELLRLFGLVRIQFNAIQPFVDFTTVLQTRLGEFAANMQHRLEVDFEAYNPINFFQALRLQAVDGAERRTLAEMGTGEQQILALSLAYAYAKAFHEGILLIIEEPESHLHPLAQQWLAQRLRTMADGGLQLVITTHSAHFLNLLDLPGVSLVRKLGGATSIVQRTVDELVEHCIAKGADPAKTTADNILQFYAANATPEILEGFFARAVVLVEGRTESLALPVLWKRLGFDHTEHGLAIIPVGGKGNLAKWKRLFEAYSIPAYLVFDNDVGDDQAGSKRLDVLASLMLPPERRNEILASSDWLVENGFAVFGKDFERTLRDVFAEYAPLEAQARQEGVEAKPFVARWVAERLPLTGDAKGPQQMRRLVASVKAWSGLSVQPTPPEA